MVYVYILTMAFVTYLIRMLPLVVFRKKIQNRIIQSFLHYVPYTCLMAMTFPSVLYSTEHGISAFAGVAIAFVLALYNRGLMTVALSSCVAVYAVELLLTYL